MTKLILSLSSDSDDEVLSCSESFHGVRLNVSNHAIDCNISPEKLDASIEISDDSDFTPLPLTHTHDDTNEINDGDTPSIQEMDERQPFHTSELRRGRRFQASLEKNDKISSSDLESSDDDMKSLLRQSREVIDISSEEETAAATSKRKRLSSSSSIDNLKYIPATTVAEKFLSGVKRRMANNSKIPLSIPTLESDSDREFSVSTKRNGVKLSWDEPSLSSPPLRVKRLVKKTSKALSLTNSSDSSVNYQEISDDLGRQPQESEELTLVELTSYDEFREPPFTVSIACTIMALIDLHSHLYETEVIGVLGGTLDTLTQTLHITHSLPCPSISTIATCEICPVALSEAKETFSSAGVDFVGWYHSHPTFNPIPSRRDCQTQLAYQRMFAGMPYCGIICNPYPSNGVGRSAFEVFRVDPRNPKDEEWRIGVPRVPFCLPAAIHKPKLGDDLALERLMTECFEIIEATLEPAAVSQMTRLSMLYLVKGVDPDTGYRSKVLDKWVEKRQHMILSMQSHLEAHYNDRDLTLLTTLIESKLT